MEAIGCRREKVAEGKMLVPKIPWMITPSGAYWSPQLADKLPRRKTFTASYGGKEASNDENSETRQGKRPKRHIADRSCWSALRCVSVSQAGHAGLANCSQYSWNRPYCDQH